MTDLLVLGAIISAVLTITAVNPVNAVIGLISVYIHIAVYLIILTLNFIGLTYLIIYVGAIAILFLFVVMMMNIKYIELSEVPQEYIQNFPLGAIIGTLFILELLSSTLMPYHSIQDTERDYKEVPLSLKTDSASHGLDESVQIMKADTSAFAPFWDSSAIFYSFSHIEGLGYTIYTYGLLWFILGSMILLLGMIGPIVLTYND
jgi:NADH-ubiquinone oxidoreductase chain 6